MNAPAWWVGLTCVTAGCLAFYLGSPHQLWPRIAVRRTRAWPLAALLLLGGLAGLLQVLQSLAAVFTFTAWMMLVFTLLPYVGALHTLCTGRHNDQK